jgi:hypothetical protein
MRKRKLILVTVIVSLLMTLSVTFVQAQEIVVMPNQTEMVDDVVPSGNDTIVINPILDTDICGDETIVDLIAGQHTDVGSVTVANDEDTLYVTFATEGGWVMLETHLAVATSLDGIPMTPSGNPRIGLFPYQTQHDPAVTEYTYEISLADAGYEPGDELFIAAHASVALIDENGDPVQQETAWGQGPEFPGNSWAMYFNFTVQSCEEDECVSDPTIVDLIAGQNTVIGSVSVWNDGDTLYVQFETNGDWVMLETHLAVATSLDGIPMTPSGNPQIGLFPYQTQHDPAVTEYTYEISLAGAGYEPGDELFIAAHASVSLLDENGDPVQQETAWGEGPGFPGNSWAMYFNFTVQEPCDEEPTDGFRTQTQGGWGATPHGNNPGVYLYTNFAGAFANGLTIGGTDAALFTGASSVNMYLPAGGTAAVLGQDYVDPTTTNAGVLGGQATALSLNVGFDLYDEDFGDSDFHLGDLVVIDNSSLCYGMTVQDVLDATNDVLGGDSTDFTPSEINECASAINENFVDGEMDGGYLSFP